MSLGDGGPCGHLRPTGTGRPPEDSSLCPDPCSGPYEKDLYFYQGDDERRSLRWEDSNGDPAADLTDAEISMQIRQGPADAFPDVLCEVSVGDGVIITNGPLAEFEFVFTSAKTVLLTGSEPYYYDLQVIPVGGDKVTIMRGSIYFDLESTRATL